MLACLGHGLATVYAREIASFGNSIPNGAGLVQAEILVIDLDGDRIGRTCNMSQCDPRQGLPDQVFHMVRAPGNFLLNPPRCRYVCPPAG